MIVEERRQKVLDLVNERGFVGLAELAKTLNTSESTIRRDLDYWEANGLAALTLDEARKIFRLVARTGDEHAHSFKRVPSG